MEKKYLILIRDSFKKTFYINTVYLKIFNEYFAQNLAKEILVKIKLLKVFPYIGPYIILNNENNVYRKLLIKKRYLLIYKIENQTIHIIYFFDSFKSINSQFKSFKF